MNILCYLSWSVDFSTYNDCDDDDNDDNDDNMLLITSSPLSIYPSIIHPAVR